MTDRLNLLLNKITIYRLMLYYLLVLYLSSVALSAFKILPFRPLDILLCGIYLLIICNLVNWLFSKLFKASVNLESASITALILTLIVGPTSVFTGFFLLAIVGSLAMASKYIFTWNKKHLFNPAAFSILVSSLLLNYGASWWIGSIHTLPLILVGGMIVAIKLKRVEMILSFLGIYLINLIVTGGFSLTTIFSLSVWFFVFVMLVEPLTSPSVRKWQITFGVVIAVSLALIQRFLPSYPYSLETSLLLGNIFSFLVTPNFNIILNLVKKERVAKDIWGFYFEAMSQIRFTAGQYLEWTFPHNHPDSRGVRRYFTIASSPSEKYLMIAVKAVDKSSSFKQALLDMKQGEHIIASSPKGDFILPNDTNTPICFIAGGIGVTPFRSMAQDLLDKKQSRDITLLYSSNTEAEVAFKEIFAKAEKLGVKTHYVITEKEGFIDQKKIKDLVPDYKDRVFYISGPEPMVEAFKKLLSEMKVKGIETDFFPGYSETFQKKS